MPQNVRFLNLPDFSNNIYFGTLKLKHLGQIPTNFRVFSFPTISTVFSFLVLKVTTHRI